MTNATNTATDRNATPDQIASARPTVAKHNPLMTTLRYGIEIETVSAAGRDGTARRVAEIMGWTVGRDGYSAAAVMPDGRKWKFVSDGSIQMGVGVEVVSPILTWADMDTVQQLVRALRQAGAKVNTSCGIHVHVDGAKFKAQPQKLANLIKLVNKREDLIHDMLGGRRKHSQWCAPIDGSRYNGKGAHPRLIERVMGGTKFRSIRTILSAYYGGRNQGGHYNPARYSGLNLHALNDKGTIEFRYFDATLHAGKVRAYLCLVLALAGKALQVRNVQNGSARSGARGAYQVVYHELGLREDYFANVREHLLAPIRAAGTASATRQANRRAVRPRDAA